MPKTNVCRQQAAQAQEEEENFVTHGEDFHIECIGGKPMSDGEDEDNDDNEELIESVHAHARFTDKELHDILGRKSARDAMLKTGRKKEQDVIMKRFYDNFSDKMLLEDPNVCNPPPCANARRINCGNKIARVHQAVVAKVQRKSLEEVRGIANDYDRTDPVRRRLVEFGTRKFEMPTS